MAQNIGLEQTQKLRQTSKLTPQQLLLVRLTEMSIPELEDCVKKELDTNVGLEEGKEKKDEIDNDDWSDEEYGEDEGGKETETQLLLGEYGSDDDVPDYLRAKTETSFKEQLPIGESVTFLDDLRGQMQDFDLDEHQTELIDYLIGSLNDNGFLELSLDRIVDEMLFKHDIETDEEELNEALKTLQQFDPPGIGARNSQESMLIQIDRKLQAEGLKPEKEKMLRLERRIIAEEYETFKNRNLEKIANNLSVDLAVIRYAFEEIVDTLNPRPGRALCESASDRAEIAIPDFIIESDSDGNVYVQLNRGEVPSLRVSAEYRRLAEQYAKKGEKIGRHEKESLQFYKEKIDEAKMFIDAIAQRYSTLYAVMQAIVSRQKQFFITKDEEDLQYLIYKDIADKINMDVSTISRVCKSKYALVDGRMYELTYFFKRKLTNAEGEEIDAANVANTIKEIIENEDKNTPLSDDEIVDELKKRNIDIKRRTVNKYRNELAIPSAKNRKV